MAETKKQGVLFTAPDGSIYHISREDLARYKVAPDKVESTILDAEAQGFVESAAESFSGCESGGEGVPPQTVPIVQSGPVVHIYIGSAPTVPVQVMGPEATAEQAAPAGGGSAMSKYAAGSAMSKYAAGSAMSKYAAGSAMSKYAAGSAMSKYAAGSTMAGPARSALTFYGDWSKGES
ncbi:hypothetical protein [Myxococcus stipitatus]|uniref:hypothetical protein n=1 Tax=Myxococcus stipitatus TaxID=83455 RepID=UPI0030CEFA00